MPIKKAKKAVKKVVKKGGAKKQYKSQPIEMFGDFTGGSMGNMDSRDLEITNVSNSNVLVPAQNKDHFYYNIEINNQTDKPINASFKETRDSAILQNPSEYTVSVIRFAINSGLIPIFNFVPVPGSNGSGNLNLNKGVYSVTLEYGDDVYQENVIYALNNYTLGDYENPPNIQNWKTINEENYEYYQIFDYENFIDMINSALATAYAKIDPNSPPKTAAAPAPFLQLNRDTGKIDLIVHRSFDSSFVDSPTIRIFMNERLYVFFNNFSAVQVNEDDGKDYFIRVKNYGNNLITQQPQLTYFAPWYGYTTYNLGDLVSYVDTSTLTRYNYRSLSNSNKNFTPYTEPTKWRLQGDYYDAAVTYSKNELVYHDLNYYISAQDGNINHQPNLIPSAPFWTLASPQDVVEPWTASKTYNLRTVVLHQGYYYISLADNNLANNPSTNTTEWTTYTGFDMYKIEQEYASLYNWNDLASFVFTTSQLPILEEYVPVQNSLNSSNAVSSGMRAILTDFVIGSVTGYDIKEPIVFTNQGEYRLINMLSNSPLRTVDLQMWWKNHDQELFPLKLAPGNKFHAGAKLMFRRKDYNEKHRE